VGYLNALALTIIVKQLPKILGYKVEADNVIAAAVGTIAKLSQTVMLSVLVAVVAATIASAVFGFQEMGLKVVGVVPSGLPSFAFPQIDLADFGSYLFPAFAIALMGFADTAVASELFADRNKYEVDADRDLYGLGAASLLSGLFGGFAVSASDSCTAVADNAGGKSHGWSPNPTGLCLMRKPRAMPISRRRRCWKN
jgi:MFS superfamily sulfate permease-like transporter